MIKIMQKKTLNKEIEEEEKRKRGRGGGGGKGGDRKKSL